MHMLLITSLRCYTVTPIREAKMNNGRDKTGLKESVIGVVTGV